MNDLDHAIRQSLSAEDNELLVRLGADQALHRQVLATFTGRRRWFNAAGLIAGVALFALACVLAWRFVQAREPADMLRWGAASAFAFAGLALIKVWFWLELQKDEIVREVKRLEVQVASLAGQLHRQ
jgi:hypothetical protein